MKDDFDVVIVGAGPAGLSAGVFTGRAGFDTLLVENESSILMRNAQIENYLGFPVGVNSRLLLEMGRDQALESGCSFREDTVNEIEVVDDGFRLVLDSGDSILSDRVVVASWSDVSFLSDIGVEIESRGSKDYVVHDGFGRTDIEGLYVAGRIGGCYHQAIISAGDGASTAVTLIDDSDEPFYHDWVAPMGYFTDRGRDVPPGCEEIDEDERVRREKRSMEVMRRYFSERHPDEPTPHPSQNP